MWVEGKSIITQSYLVEKNLLPSLPSSFFFSHLLLYSAPAWTQTSCRYLGIQREAHGPPGRRTWNAVHTLPHSCEPFVMVPITLQCTSLCPCLSSRAPPGQGGPLHRREGLGTEDMFKDNCEHVRRGPDKQLLKHRARKDLC